MHAKIYCLSLGILLAVCRAEGVQLQIDRVDAPAGAEDVAVRLTAEDAAELAGADLEIHYDPALLAVGDIETGALSAGWILATNRREAGAIRLSLAGQTGAQLAAGDLSILHFSVRPEATPGAVAPIRLVGVRLYDETAASLPSVDLQDGALTVLAEVPPPREEELVEPFILEIPSATGFPDDEVSVEIGVDRTEGIAGGDFALIYDPVLLTPLSVEPTWLTAHMMLAANLSSPGRIAVSLAGATGMPEGEGAILTVRFTVDLDASPGAESILRLTHARLIDARALPLPIGEMTEGRFRIASQFPYGTARLDLNPLSADQGMREKGGVGPNAELPVQIFARDLPDVKGYTLTLEFDPDEITFDRFEVGDFVPGLLVLPPQGSGGAVEVGGTSLTGGSNSGDGFLGTVYVRTNADFAGDAALDLTVLSLNLADGGTEKIDPRTGALFTSGGGIEGDFDLDGQVGFPDFFLFAENFGLDSGDPGYSPLYDLDGDGSIYFADFFLFADLFTRLNRTGD